MESHAALIGGPFYANRSMNQTFADRRFKMQENRLGGADLPKHYRHDQTNPYCLPKLALTIFC